MRFPRFLAALLFAATTPAILPGQSVARQFGSDLENAGRDMVAIWLSPFDASSRSWLLAAGAIGGSALLLPIDDNVDRWAVRNRNAGQLSFLKELRRGGLVYGGNRLVPYAIGAYAIALATNNQGIRDGIFGCVASYVSGSVLRNQVFYRLIARERPDSGQKNRRDGVPAEPPPAKDGDQYNIRVPGDGDDWGMHSLPGGHVANIMSCATFLNRRFEMGVAEPILYAIAGGVGVGRLLDRGHWMSDQVIGVVFGYAIGNEIAQRSLGRRDDRRAAAAAAAGGTTSLRVLPSTRGISVGWNVVF